MGFSRVWYDLENNMILLIFCSDKKVFPNLYILGWYSTGSETQESNMNIHNPQSCKFSTLLFVCLFFLVGNSCGFDGNPFFFISLNSWWISMKVLFMFFSILQSIMHRRFFQWLSMKVVCNLCYLPILLYWICIYTRVGTVYI